MALLLNREHCRGCPAQIRCCQAKGKLGPQAPRMLGQDPESNLIVVGLLVLCPDWIVALRVLTSWVCCKV
jgi:hypothetical protein